MVIWFIESITKGLEKSMTKDNFHTLLDLTYEDAGYEKMKEMESKQPALLDQILSSHFCSLFLLDILQFSFSYFVVAKTFN